MHTCAHTLTCIHACMVHTHAHTHTQNNRPEIAGSTCTGFDDIYQKLRDFAVKEKARVAEGGER